MKYAWSLFQIYLRSGAMQLFFYFYIDLYTSNSTWAFDDSGLHSLLLVSMRHFVPLCEQTLTP